MDWLNGRTYSSAPSMARLPYALLLAAALLASPALADDSVAEGLKSKANPLLKALSLVGTPYKFGGKDPEKGVDCSGLVRHVYKDANGVDLPHNARRMSQSGAPVAKDELKPGDLVFFNTLKRPFSHVGIYKGNGEFVHASSGRAKEVTVSRLDEPYWSKRFNGARRIPATE